MKCKLIIGQSSIDWIEIIRYWQSEEIITIWKYSNEANDKRVDSNENDMCVENIVPFRSFAFDLFQQSMGWYIIRIPNQLFTSHQSLISSWTILVSIRSCAGLAISSETSRWKSFANRWNWYHRGNFIIRNESKQSVVNFCSFVVSSITNHLSHHYHNWNSSETTPVARTERFVDTSKDRPSRFQKFHLFIERDFKDWKNISRVIYSRSQKLTYFLWSICAFPIYSRFSAFLQSCNTIKHKLSQ
jgi:hypothetical protein